MSPYRGPLRSLLAAAAVLVLLLAVYGCSNDDLSNPESTFGTIEVQMPTEKMNVQWHLYGPGDSFHHGQDDQILDHMPTGRYTIIWTAHHERTAPPPTHHHLAANRTLTLHGVYEDKAPGSNFALLASGGFVMGSEDGTRDIITPGDPPDTTRVPAEVGRDGDEERHHVDLSNGFFLGKTEITNQEYVELGNWAIAAGHATVTETALLDALDGSTVELINFDFADTPIDVQDGMLRLKRPEDALRPVIEVTWYGAASYCDWLSLNESLTRAYDHSDWTVNGGDVYGATGYRLPTEAEWEYACRAGTVTAYSSGDAVTGDCVEEALASVAWYCGTADNHAYDVGTKAANPWGLFDMHGNVWEWCNDIYGGYDIPEPDPDNPDEIIWSIDPTGPDEGENRCVRSGRWLLAGSLCRSAARMMAAPDFRGINIGFRPAITETPVP